jgi:parallel beta-helix repeat protein
MLETEERLEPSSIIHLRKLLNELLRQYLVLAVAEGERKLRRLFSGIVLALLLASALAVAFNVQPVRAEGTIYIRADGSIDPSDVPISSLDNVTYTFTGNINDSIVVQRDNIAVDGEGYILSVGYPQYDIGLIDRSNVTIKDMKIQGLWSWGGIALMRSSNCTISGNNITADSHLLPWGLRLDNSSDNKIVNNTFTNNSLYALFSYKNTVENNTVNGKPLVYLENVSDRSVNDAGQVILVRCTNVRVKDLNLLSITAGVELFETNNTTISENNITENNLGIMLKSSSNNTITANNIKRTISGIWLEGSPNNTISRNDIAGVGLYLGSNTGMNLRYSNHNSISGNNITNNEIGIIFEWNSDYNCVYENNITENVYGIGAFGSGDGLEYSNNTICHNNFVNNSIQVRTSLSMNVWNYGYPSGGNYWSNYTGIDLHSGPYQNVTGSDGIGDTPYAIDSNNTDHYPLMGEFHQFFTLYGQEIRIVSNSSVSRFNFSPVSSTAALTFNVTGKYGTHGFCQVCIPKALINGSFIVMFDGKPVGEEYAHILPTSNENYTYIYINYTHCKHTIKITGTPIIPEFPSFLIMPLFMMATLLAVAICRRKRFKT